MYSHDWVNWASGHCRIKCPRSNCQMEKCTVLRQSAKDRTEAQRPVLSARRLPPPRLLLLPSHWLARSWFGALAICHQVATVWNQYDGASDGRVDWFVWKWIFNGAASQKWLKSKRRGNVEAASRTVLALRQTHCLVERSARDKCSWLRWNKDSQLIPVPFSLHFYLLEIFLLAFC